MSNVVTNNVHGAIDFTKNGVTFFPAIVGPTDFLLGVRVSIGFGEIAGICRITASIPAGAVGTLKVEQSPDGLNYDVVESFPLTLAGGAIPFVVKVVGRFMRVRFNVPAATTQDVRFGAQLKPLQSP